MNWDIATVSSVGGSGQRSQQSAQLQLCRIYLREQRERPREQQTSLNFIETSVDINGWS